LFKKSKQANPTSPSLNTFYYPMLDRKSVLNNA